MPKLGVTSKLYYNTGSYGTPTWTEISLVSDLTITPTWDEADGSVRASRVKQIAKTLLGIEVSGKIRVDESDTAYNAMLEASYADTVLDIMVLNGASDDNGVRGYRFDAQVFGMTEDQSMGAVLYNDFVLKPTVSSNLAKSVEVASGAPAFTTIG